MPRRADEHHIGKQVRSGGANGPGGAIVSARARARQPVDERDPVEVHGATLSHRAAADRQHPVACRCVAAINLYSDTQTRPTPGMRAAIAAAEVGDKQRDQDPTTRALEERVAELLGQEAAVFL